MSETRRLSRVTSGFLDMLRILAAAIVFASHCAQYWNPRLWAELEPLGHAAVVVFFVLSGYVVTYSTMSRPQRDPRVYIVARLSRLYSVVAPALLLTATLAFAGAAINPVLYAGLSRGFDGVRYALSALFLQNVWWLSASPPSNGPLWSLSYEFWYYVLFGCAVFVRPRSLRLASLAIVAAIAGPNILLLMPCWVIGALICLGRQRLARRIAFPRATFIAGGLLLVASIVAMPALPLPHGAPRWFFSASFLTDWVTALAVAMLVASVAAMPLRWPGERAVAWLRRGGDLTFPLYLFHYPLIVFVTAALPFDRTNPLQVAAVVAGLLVVVVALGTAVEATRPRWTRLLDGLLARAADAGTAARPRTSP